jgi:hypothetical protein
VSLPDMPLFAELLRDDEPIVDVSVLLLRVELGVSVVVLEPAIEPLLLGLDVLAAPLVLPRGVFAVLPLGAVCVLVLGPGVSFADGGLVFLPVSLIAPEPVVAPLLLVCA